MGIKAVRVGGVMPGAGASVNRRPVLSWVASRREAARLREAREDAGLTQRELAARLGHAQPWVLFRERGKTLLTADEVEQIEQAIKGEGGG